ncbi:hypothetical protein [Paenibacillus lemnae]|uniref:Uncharacterized protein n=1 Tax=Paenibacillus lemnae TaxID=1330551 RepID=A0A848ME00_PAELE|nr:hypothetical protein [Paenibacillus lemnae]NMO98282.1 hypothetical protein [Paenibacillus lemnae]
MIFNKPLDHYDFFIQSENTKSHIIFSFIDIELERSKSINYLVNVKDDLFAGQVDIWIDHEEFNHFIEGILKSENSEVEQIRLKAMSQEELEVTFVNQRMGHYEIAYLIKKIRYSQNRLIETTLKGSFDYDSEFLNLLKENLKNIQKLLL